MDSPELSKQLVALVGHDMIREWQITHRAGQVQVMPLLTALLTSGCIFHTRNLSLFVACLLQEQSLLQGCNQHCI